MIKNDCEIESAILGNCIGSIDKLTELLNIGVTAEDFYNTTNQKIYDLLIKCYGSKKNTEYYILKKMAMELNILPSYISNLQESTIKVNDIKPLVDELLRMRITRERLKMADDIKHGILENDSDIQKRIESIRFIESKINNINTVTTLDKVKIVDVYKMEKIPTGFIDIDKKILGIVFGSLNIITGYNGNGKSTLINQMCIAESLSRGYKVFAYSPELTNSNFKSWLYPTIANGDHFVEKTNYFGEKYKTISNQGINYIDNWIKDKLYIYSDDSVTSDERQLLLDMDNMAREGVRVFVVDNLMKIDLIESYKNEYIAQKNFVNKLKEFARKYNVIVHLVAHPKKPQDSNKKITKYDVAGSGDITNLADCVMSISRTTEKDKEEKPSLKDSVIKVMKDRIKGSSEFAIDVFFDKARRRFYSHQAELNKDYGYTKGIEFVQVDMDNNVF